MKRIIIIFTFMQYYPIIVNKHGMIWMQHPGGLDVIMEYGGRDATVAFMDKGHSKDAWIVLSDYYIGELVKVSDNALTGNRPRCLFSNVGKRVIFEFLYPHQIVSKLVNS